MSDTSPRPEQITFVIRCTSYDESHHFYRDVLGLVPIEEWIEHDGRGCLFSCGPEGEGGLIEISEPSPSHPRHAARSLEEDRDSRIEVHLRVASVEDSTARLDGQWAYNGPVRTSWGEQWVTLKDPDGVRIVLSEEGSLPPDALSL